MGTWYLDWYLDYKWNLTQRRESEWKKSHRKHVFFY